MAKYQYKNNGPSAEDRALDVFADLMIKKIESVSSNWQKPWFTKNALQWPKNLSGREYNGMNALILMFQQENKGWNSNRFATFERISSLNFDDNRKPLVDKEGNKLPFVTVTKGEKSTPVMFTSFTVVHKETHDKIKYDDYKNLPDDEKLNYSVYPKLQVYNVFNIDQTNIKEARPELYAKFNQEYEEVQHNNEKETMEIPAVDTMIKNDLYVCPIKPPQQDRAYYDSNKDTIVVPLKEQFKNGEAFYGTLFHEMSHASGAQNRLNRFASGDHFGSPSYAREELVAELTAALLSTRYGMEKNLKEENVHGEIFVTGNTVIDALYMVVEKLKADPALHTEQEQVLLNAGNDVNRLNDGKRLIHITGHRRENFGDGFIRMISAMKDLSEKYLEVDFVYPMHLNPNVRKPIHEVFGEDLTRPNFFFIEPLQYIEFVHLMSKANIVLTDSGGIQEEAPSLGKPVLVMRDTTERPEALASGTVHLVGTDYDKIVNEVSTLLDDEKAYEKMSKAVNPYGDGKACSRIVAILNGENPVPYGK